MARNAATTATAATTRSNVRIGISSSVRRRGTSLMAPESTIDVGQERATDYEGVVDRSASTHLRWCRRAQSSSTSPSVIPRSA